MNTAEASKTRRFSALALAVAALTAATFSTASLAAPTQDSVPSIKVLYGDLDLSSDAGNATLYQRIATAARRVCPSAHSVELTDVIVSQKCQDAAIAKAVHDVNSPQLALLRTSRTQHG